MLYQLQETDLVVRCQNLFQPTSECIIIMQSAVDGFLTSLHISLDYPTCHQLQLVIKWHFYAWNLGKATEHVRCAMYMLLWKIPQVNWYSSHPRILRVFGCSHTADVLRHNRQLILVLREWVSSYTKTCLIPNKKVDTLHAAILTMILDLYPLERPTAIICVDLAPGFISPNSRNRMCEKH